MFVEVDMGYGPAENWVAAKVIDKRSVSRLFDNKKQTDLLVELPSKERVWVPFWREV